jgi:hypothetical protein
MIISDLSYWEKISESSVAGGNDVSQSTYELTTINGQVVNERISGTPPKKIVGPDGTTTLLYGLDIGLLRVDLPGGLV